MTMSGSGSGANNRLRTMKSNAFCRMFSPTWKIPASISTKTVSRAAR